LIEYESKIVNDLWNSNAFILKPNESQMIDFLKRIKNLNKTTLSKAISDKLELQDAKSLLKSLYIIEALFQKRNQDFNILMKNKVSVFTLLKEKFKENNKMVEIINNIMPFLEEDNTFNGLEVRKKDSSKASNKDVNGFSFIKGKEELNKVDSANINVPRNKGFSFINSKNIEIKEDCTPKDNILDSLSTYTFVSSDNDTKSIIEPPKSNHLSNLLDIDKLYAEYSDNQSRYNANVHFNTINYHENYHLSLSDLDNKNGSSYNQYPIKPVDIPKIERKIVIQSSVSTFDHFIFVNDLMKTK